MNNPGPNDAIADDAITNDAIANEANALDRTSPYDEKDDTREVNAHHPHAARWWLASTAYPLAAVSITRPLSKSRCRPNSAFRVHSGRCPARSTSVRYHNHGVWRYFPAAKEETSMTLNGTPLSWTVSFSDINAGSQGSRSQRGLAELCNHCKFSPFVEHGTTDPVRGCTAHYHHWVVHIIFRTA